MAAIYTQEQHPPCRTCGSTSNGFYPSDKVRTRCKKCHVAQGLAWKRKHKDKVNELERALRAALPAEVRALKSQRAYAKNKESITIRNKAYVASNREAVAARQARWSKENREHIRATHIKRTYDITLEDIAALWAAQGEGCGICGAAENGGRSMAIDHCHTTGKVRGLLCNKCNTAIGLLHDDTRVVEKALAYLKRDR